MKRLIALLLCLSLLMAVGCGEQPAQTEPPTEETPSTEAALPQDHYLKLALYAQDDLYDHFWDEENNHFIPTSQGYADPMVAQSMIWEHSMAIFDMYTLWFALEEDSVDKKELYDKFVGEWAFLKESFTYEQMTGNFGSAPNIAIDDTGWGAMTYMIMYDVLGDEDCLRLTRDCVRNAYDFFKDGEVGNGLWYHATLDTVDTQSFKSMSYVGLMYAALEYTMATGDTCLLEDTLALYDWTEENMLRSGTKTYENALSGNQSLTVEIADNLYWMDYNVNRSGRAVINGPDGGHAPQTIDEASSVSCLFANMAMGCIHAMLYEITGEQSYLDNAIRTLRALNDCSLYSFKGAYVNDRDAWADAMFVGPWVRRVLTLPGVTEEDHQRIFITADHITQRARTEDGYYQGGWSGSKVWNDSNVPQQIMTTATTVNMVTAAALLEQLLQES